MSLIMTNQLKVNNLMIVQLEETDEVTLNISVKFLGNESTNTTMSVVKTVTDAIDSMNNLKMNNTIPMCKAPVGAVTIESCLHFDGAVRYVNPLHNRDGDVVGLSIIVPRI